MATQARTDAHQAVRDGTHGPTLRAPEDLSSIDKFDMIASWALLVLSIVFIFVSYNVLVYGIVGDIVAELRRSAARAAPSHRYSPTPGDSRRKSEPLAKSIGASKVAVGDRASQRAKAIRSTSTPRRTTAAPDLAGGHSSATQLTPPSTGRMLRNTAGIRPITEVKPHCAEIYPLTVRPIEAGPCEEARDLVSGNFNCGLRSALRAVEDAHEVNRHWTSLEGKTRPASGPARADFLSPSAPSGGFAVRRGIHSRNGVRLGALGDKRSRFFF